MASEPGDGVVEQVFACGMGAIERTPEYVRLIFRSPAGILSVALTPAAFEQLTALVAIGADRILN